MVAREDRLERVEEQRVAAVHAERCTSHAVRCMLPTVCMHTTGRTRTTRTTCSKHGTADALGLHVTAQLLGQAWLTQQTVRRRSLTGTQVHAGGLKENVPHASTLWEIEREPFSQHPRAGANLKPAMAAFGQPARAWTQWCVLQRGPHAQPFCVCFRGFECCAERCKCVVVPIHVNQHDRFAEKCQRC